MATLSATTAMGGPPGSGMVGAPGSGMGGPPGSGMGGMGGVVAGSPPPMTMGATPGGVNPPAPVLGSGILPQRVRQEDTAASHITVSDPVMHSEGLNKYTSYRVEVRGAPGQMAQPQQAQMNYSAVLRRYSDFLWLYDRLHKERAGAIMPPLPEKQAVGRLDPAFVEERRVQLQRFLRRVAIHPELSDAAALNTFLRADDVTFNAAKNAKNDAMPMMGANPAMQGNYAMSGMHQSGMMQPSMIPGMGGHLVPQAPSQANAFKRWFSETKTSLTGDLVRSPDDDLFEEIERYIGSLEDQMKEVVNQVSVLVRRGKEVANGMFELGLAFNLLGQAEADVLGAALTKVGGASDSLSGLTSDHAAGEADKFEEPLRDYLKTLHSVKQALARRHERRVTFSTALQDLNAKQVALGKLRATPGQEGKAYAAEMSLRRAQESADMIREDFATVSQRVLREVDRFKREKAEDMRLTVFDYIQLQIEHNKRMEEVWSALVKELESMPLDKVGEMALPPMVHSAGLKTTGEAPVDGTQISAMDNAQQQMPTAPQQQPMMPGSMPTMTTTTTTSPQPGMMMPPPPPQPGQQPQPQQTMYGGTMGMPMGGGGGGGLPMAGGQANPMMGQIQYRDTTQYGGM